MSIDPATAIGAVHLTIANLERSVDFYQTRLGFVVHARAGATARLGAGGRDLLVLAERRDAVRVPGTTGLYHFAILVPSRVDLARSLQRLVETSTTLQGFADHGVSEALYLADPDGNGIEVYHDRPRAEWPVRNGQLHMGADPLDVESILAELAPPEPMTSARHALARETTVGHMHLHVRDLAEAEQFYVKLLGFDLIQRYGRAALFVSAGGYHHHVGLNTWAGVGAPPPPSDSLGLRYFVIRVPDRAALDRIEQRLRDGGVTVARDEDGLVVRDPSQNTMAIRTER